MITVDNITMDEVTALRAVQSAKAHVAKVKVDGEDRSEEYRHMADLLDGLDAGYKKLDFSIIDLGMQGTCNRSYVKAVAVLAHCAAYEL